MKLPIKVTHTSYVEFDTPSYYKSKHGIITAKIYDDGIMQVGKEHISNYRFEKTHYSTDQHYVDLIRELLETGIPITKKEFDEAYTITANHLNIISK